MDSNGQIIVGKSDKNKEIFDTIIFANRDIRQATITSCIKYIKKGAFENCEKLKAIEISEDSKFTSLCKNFLSFSSIVNFFIPASVEVIKDEWCNIEKN